MEPLTTLRVRSLKSSLTILFVSVSFFALAIEAHAQAFDFSLSAVGPRNVVQGHDIYIKISGQTVSGSGGNTTLSVPNKPTGISSFWPDLKKTCCGDGFDGSYWYASATFATALQLTVATTTPAGNHTILVTAVNNGVTRQLPYTFTVHAVPASTTPPAISMPAIPNLSTWQSNMTTYGQQVCNYLDTPGLTFAQRFNWIYYDQIRVMYQISDYIPGSSSYWNACALKARAVYRDEYVIPEGGNVPGHYVFTTGLRMDYERTGDLPSKNAALLLSQNAAFVEDSTLVIPLIDASVSRETAYAILAKLDDEKLGSATNPRLISLVDIALGHMDQWFVSKTYRCTIPGACEDEAAVGKYYIQPFMVGLTMRALIVYYEKTADPRIPPMIKTAADWLWANAWVANDQAFWYQNWVSDPSQTFPAQQGAADLNLLIAPAYAWLYRQTGDATYQSRGDQIFSGGVTGSGTLSNGKQFDQNYIWSFDYVKWRTTSTPPAASVAVSNFGFETPAMSYGLFEYQPTGGSWTFAPGAGVSANGSGFTGANPSAPEGAQVGFIQYNGQISQAISGFQANTNYTVTFAAARRVNSASSQNFQVYLDNTLLGTFNPTSTNYADFSTNQFTTTAGTHTLKFVGLNSSGGDNTAFIDNVRINASATPAASVAVSNFGFETPAMSYGLFEYQPTGGFWTFAPGAGVSANGSGFTGANPSAPEGAQVGFIQYNGQISQAISGFQANTNYTVTFAAARRVNSASSQNFEVYLDNTLLGTFNPTSTSYANYSTNQFTTTAGTHTLKFVGLNSSGGDNTAFIDNVRINASP